MVCVSKWKVPLEENVSAVCVFAYVREGCYLYEKSIICLMFAH